jgi:hypothetical protein
MFILALTHSYEPCFPLSVTSLFFFFLLNMVKNETVFSFYIHFTVSFLKWKILIANLTI